MNNPKEFRSSDEYPNEIHSRLTDVRFNEQGVILNCDLAETITSHVKEEYPDVSELVIVRLAVRAPRKPRERLMHAIFGEDIQLGIEHFPALALGFHREAQMCRNAIASADSDVSKFQAEQQIDESEVVDMLETYDWAAQNAETARDQLLKIMPPHIREAVIRSMFGIEEPPATPEQPA